MARPGWAVPFDSVGPVPRATERGSGLVYSIRWSVPTVAGTGASSCTPTLTTRTSTRAPDVVCLERGAASIPSGKLIFLFLKKKKNIWTLSQHLLECIHVAEEVNRESEILYTNETICYTQTSAGVFIITTELPVRA